VLQEGGGLIVVSTYRSFLSILLPLPLLMLMVVVEVVKRISTTSRRGRGVVVVMHRGTPTQPEQPQRKLRRDFPLRCAEQHAIAVQTQRLGPALTHPRLCWQKSRRRPRPRRKRAKTSKKKRLIKFYY
jgi:hypothetical protein